MAGFIFFLVHSNIMAQDIAKYLSPFTPIEKGKTPGMKSRLLSDVNGVKSYVLVFGKGDEVMSGITDFATDNHITTAHFTAIGALKDATSAWFDESKKEFKLNHINHQVELVSLIGNIALYEGKPIVHIHFSVGYPDGTVQGGHLIEALVFPTV
jgi:hypothetical protein